MRRSPFRRKPRDPDAADAKKTRWPGKTMRRRSTAKAREYELRRDLVEAMLDGDPRCQAGERILLHLVRHDAPYLDRTCGGYAVADDVHELLPRSAGGSIVDRANCIAVCRGCHRWIHEHPSVSRSIGLLRSRYDRA